MAPVSGRPYAFSPKSSADSPIWPSAPWQLLQALLVGLNHFLEHLAADGAGLAGGQVTVVAVLQVHANLL